MTTETTLKLSGEPPNELATILVALRNWQLTLLNLCIGEGDSKGILAAVGDCYSEYVDHFRGCQPLTIDEIDALYEKLSQNQFPPAAR